MTPPIDSPYPRPRNPRACESCRTSKVRCFPSNKPNICQRCAKSDTPCIVSTELRTRSARKPKHPVPVQQQTPAESPAVPAVTGQPGGQFPITLPKIPKLDLSDAVAVLQQHHENTFNRLYSTPEGLVYCPYTGSQCTSPEPSPPASKPTSVQNVENFMSSNRTPTTDSKRTIGQRDMTIDCARVLLNSFREMSSYFPFVVLPEPATVETLSRDSPFLLLAVLMVGAVKDMELQHQLDHELKRVLGTKLIVDGQKNLDFLQGLLIYIAWFPTHLKPRQVQQPMYMNMAISLSQDLGLDHPKPLGNLALKQVDTKGLLDGESFTKAAQRAYMGCYYLSLALCTALQTANHIEYSRGVEAHGVELGRNPEVPTDSALLTLVRGQHIGEMIHETVARHSKSILTSVPLHIEQQVVVYRNWISPDVRALPYLSIADKFIDIILYSGNLGFLRYYHLKHEGQLSSAMLAKCVEGCKRFFEYLLSRPAIQLVSFTSVQWSTLIQAIVILSRLSFPIPTCPGWNPQIARDQSPLIMYLDCICYRTGSLSSEPVCSPEPPKSPDAPLIMKMVIESVKKNLEPQLLLTSPGSSLLLNQDSTGVSYTESQTVLSYCPMLDPALVGYLESWPGTQHDVSPYGIQKPVSSRGEKSIVVYHDLWATMTMSWAD